MSRITANITNASPPKSLPHFLMRIRSPIPPLRYIQIMWKIERGVIFDYNKRRVPPKSAPAKGDT
ncbi:MAG: hypothetical protein ABIL00_06285, partial [candidate division WOR-3 bacterium]